jgi:hypothetical protein
MFGDFQFGLRQVEYLAALDDGVRLVGVELPTTTGALLRQVNFYLVWLGNTFEGLALMPLS